VSKFVSWCLPSLSKCRKATPNTEHCISFVPQQSPWHPSIHSGYISGRGFQSTSLVWGQVSWL
jgi:hypothetical protein